MAIITLPKFHWLAYNKKLRFLSAKDDGALNKKKENNRSDKPQKHIFLLLISQMAKKKKMETKKCHNKQ